MTLQKCLTEADFTITATTDDLVNELAAAVLKLNRTASPITHGLADLLEEIADAVRDDHGFEHQKIDVRDEPYTIVAEGPQRKFWGRYDWKAAIELARLINADAGPVPAEVSGG